MSDMWRTAEGIFIPKEDGTTEVGKFRTISLLNVEGKLYFSHTADRIMKYALMNQYIDKSVQKGGVPAISGCLEHTAVLSQLIREAKARKKNLVITWLDIANAYGSIPHNLIQAALRQAYVPDEICKLVVSYYSDVTMRFTTGHFTTEWQRVEKGIITGCTLSVVLFALAMTWLVLSMRKETKGPKMLSGQEQANIRLFMDDIATATETLVQSKHLLKKLSSVLEWAGLLAKPEKCRSLVIIKGKVSKRTLDINGKAITSITEKPVKYLGKWYKATMNEKEQIDSTVEGVKKDLKTIGKCKLPGRYKAWIVQHMLLPRMMWPLTIYNVPETKVEEIQICITRMLKKWLGLPRALSVDVFYSKSMKLQLPYSSVIEEVRVSKARSLVTLQQSEDRCVSGADIEVDGGRKANTGGLVENALFRLQMEEIVGIPNVGREGLGVNKRSYFSSSGKTEQRDMIVKHVRGQEEEKRRVRITNLGKQGAPTRWQVPERKVTHRDVIRSSEASLKFLVKSVYDLLPTPANKNLWFKSEENKCVVCGGNGTLNHILAGCPVALAQGRYTWRHDQVLRELANGVDRRRLENNKLPLLDSKRRVIAFVKAGQVKQRPEVNTCPSENFLSKARDWKLEVDLNGRLVIPWGVADTSKRPDMMLISKSSRSVGFIELTVPTEDRVEVSGELKKTRYQEIVKAATLNRWKVQLWAVEVGCRGFPAASVSSMLRDIGMSGRERKQLSEKLGKVAEVASNLLWRMSHVKEWGMKK